MAIEKNEKVGLIGANGSGKSTLIGALGGQIEIESGRVIRERGAKTRIAVVEQTFPKDATGTALSYLLEDILTLRRRLRVMEDEMANAEGDALEAALARYAECRERYDDADGDEAETQAATTLDRLGLGYMADTPVDRLSGGEKNRLQIARAINARPELIVLDEPGNHLDAWGLDWLEGLLTSYPAAVLMVSHNRYLLDRVVSRIVRIRDRSATSYTGNYSAYRAATLREAIASATDARADRKHLDRLEAMVAYLAQLARARADTGIGRRLRARRTQLERAQAEARTAERLDDGKVRLRLTTEGSKADIALDVADYSLGFPGRTLLEDATVRIGVGEKVALVGPNGCGKTTFLERLVHDASWDHDRLRLGPSMRVAYCSQAQNLFDDRATVEENLQEARSTSRDAIYTLIARYLFAYRDLDRPVGTLSGGEKSRLQLARAELIGANFLVLDEPTNHLDIPAREAVEQALIDFEGTILVVSHDRYLLDSVVGRVLSIHNRSLHDYDGGFSEFWLTAGRFQGSVGAAGKSIGTGGAKRSGPSQIPGRSEPSVGSARNRQSGSAKQDDTERRLIDLETRRVRLERDVETAYAARDLPKAKALSRELEKTRTLYDRLYAEWGA